MNHLTLYNSDCRHMSELADDSIQACVTSPPYWGLRKYKAPDITFGGDDNCEHEWVDSTCPTKVGKQGMTETDKYAVAVVESKPKPSNTCSLCGAWKGQFGLEPTVEMYVAHTIEILREIKRVLRPDGVCFWNIGDSYWGGKGQSAQAWSTSHTDRDTLQKPQGQITGMNETRPQDGKHEIIKPKDLCLIPFRVALAAQADGWWVRSDIIWNKPNPMPESVTDRPTDAYEHIFMLTKSARYYWDIEAVKEAATEGTDLGILRGKKCGGDDTGKVAWQAQSIRDRQDAGIDSRVANPSGTRNLRNVWTFPTQPYKEAHFATFPEKLPELCIKAVTSEKGCCSKCGKPWERIVEHKNMVIERTDWGEQAGNRTATSGTMVAPPETKTIGWQPTCNCNAEVTPCTVLDPFAGSGTTLFVARKLGRLSVGYEISHQYCQLIEKRNQQYVLGF